MSNDRPLVPLARRFRFHDTVLGAVVAGYGPEDWAAAPEGRGGNPPHWILGHLTSTRRHLARMLGAELPPEPWEEGFRQGAARPGGGELRPEPGFLIETFVAAGRALAERCDALGPNELAAGFGGRFPDGSDTLAGAAHFLYFHEAYHLGQLGLLHRIRGFPPFA